MEELKNLLNEKLHNWPAWERIEEELREKREQLSTFFFSPPQEIAAG